jgi:lysophospholipase L1-like esterase
MRGNRHSRSSGRRRPARGRWLLLTALAGAGVLLWGGQPTWLGAYDGARPSADHGSERPAPASEAPLRSVLGLGDSVPAATGCSCPSFVVQLGQGLAQSEGTSVAVDNEAVSGLTSAGLLQQVRQRAGQPRADRLTVITIGANDFDASKLSTPGCRAGDGLSCYQAALASMGTRVDAILAALTGGPAPHGPILVTGYWNVFLDGAVGAARGGAYTRDSDALTRAVNALLQSVAGRHAVTYVDLYGPFKMTGDADDTTLLAPDGDHPSAAGHALIASVLRRALLPPI